MPWTTITPEWLAENRAKYTWEHLERDLALETWLTLSMARSACDRLKKLDLHPFDIKQQVILMTYSGDGLLRVLDAMVTISLQAGARAATKDG